MSGDAINFRAARMVRREVDATNDEWTDLGPSADLAIWIDDIIVDGLRSGLFSIHELGRAAGLSDVPTRVIGGDLASVAEGQYYRIYGCDPCTFMTNLTNSRS